MESKVKLIVLDLDGTLLGSDKRVPQSAARALEYAVSKGVAVVPCTGRPLHGIPAEVSALCSNPRYAITSNGAAVYSAGESKRLLRLTALDVRAVEEVRKLTLNKSVNFEVYCDGYGIASEAGYLRAEEFYPPEMLDYYHSSRRTCPDMSAFIAEHWDRIEKVNLTFLSQKLRQRLRDELGGIAGMQATTSSPNNLELISSRVSKGEALLWLADMLDIRQDETAAFGDGENDIPLLTVAGTSIAMGNASKSVQSFADIVTASNDEDGIAKAIERLSI